MEKKKDPTFSVWFQIQCHKVVIKRFSYTEGDEPVLICAKSLKVVTLRKT